MDWILLAVGLVGFSTLVFIICYDARAAKRGYDEQIRRRVTRYKRPKIKGTHSVDPNDPFSDLW